MRELLVSHALRGIGKLLSRTAVIAVRKWSVARIAHAHRSLSEVPQELCRA
jgi:hypothetical protein